eukprot:7215906-Ditylum_brightwellii.AAC.1
MFLIIPYKLGQELDLQSRAGVCLGHSPCHAGIVALVLNLQTGHMSLQCHLVFDDEFTTVPYIDLWRLHTTGLPQWQNTLRRLQVRSSPLPPCNMRERWLTQMNRMIPLPEMTAK